MENNNKILSILFLAILALPIVAMGLKVNGPALDENRMLAPLPRLGVDANFSKLYTNYINDHFGLRNWFIVTNRKLRYNLLGVSPNKAITIGKDDWLFYTPDINYIDTVNGQPFSPNDLEQIKNNLEGIQSEFIKKGVRFYFLVAPNKQTIYPEKLPDYVKQVNPWSRLDQLTDYLKKFPEVNFVNPKEELIVAKSIKPVYLKYDTHWNQNGALVAINKLFQKMGIDLNPTKFWETEVVAENNDLVKQMGVVGNFVEMEPVFNYKEGKVKSLLTDCLNKYTNCPLVIEETSNNRLPRLVMYRDSFGVNMIPFISNYFAKSTYIWNGVPHTTEVISKEKPNVVIMELTERELWRLKDKLFEF